MIPAAVIALFLQAPDTLAPAAVYSVKELPVVRAAEVVRVDTLVSAPQAVADLLRAFTGVQVKDYGGAGGLKTVNVRSLGSEHVGIFLDGIQVDNAQNMQVDLGRFSTDGLGTVSLYNGQKTSRLQTAKEYASGAAVHLESAVPSVSGGQVRLRGGSFATVNPSADWSHRLGSRLMLRAAAEFLYSSGRYKYPYFDTTLVRENGDIRSLRVEAQLFGQVPGGQWQARIYSYGSERGFPGPVIRRGTSFPFSAERQADQDLFVQGGWTQEWTGRYSTAVRFKYANNYTHYNTHPEKNPMALPYNLHYRQQSGYLSIAQSLVLAGPWSVDLSTDVQRNALDSDVGQFVTPRRTTLTGALATRVVWQKFRAAAHLVYVGAWDRFDTPSAGGWSRADTYRDSWMPSLSLFWTPLSWLEVDAFVKRSYRLPSFNDLYYSLMGNANLVPEAALQTGADLRFSARPGAWQLELRVSPYYNRVSNKIVAIPTLSQFRWTMLNIGLADITGTDVKASADWHGGPWRVSGTLRYSFQQALDHSTADSRTWGNQIPYIPRHSGSVSLVLGWKDLTVNWDSSFTGGRWSRTANIPDYYLAPWSLSSAAAHYTVHLPGQGTVGRTLLLGVNIDNVFNTSYQIVQGYPMPGISLRLSAAFRWQ